MIKVFRLPGPEEDSIIAADPADGGKDFCAAVAKSRKHADSFMVFHERLEGSQFGYELHKMALYIKKKTGRLPLIGVERNTGGATIAVLRSLNYPFLFRMKAWDEIEQKESNKIGWVTNSQTRPKMLDELALSLKQRLNRIYDIDTIKEMMAFIRSPRTGKPQAIAGNNDDLVIAEAIAWQLYQTTSAQAPESLAEKAKQFPINDVPSFAR